MGLLQWNNACLWNFCFIIHVGHGRGCVRCICMYVKCIYFMIPDSALNKHLCKSIGWTCDMAQYSSKQRKHFFLLMYNIHYLLITYAPSPKAIAPATLYITSEQVRSTSFTLHHYAAWPDPECRFTLQSHHRFGSGRQCQLHPRCRFEIRHHWRACRVRPCCHSAGWRWR